MSIENREIEVRFLEIDVTKTIAKILEIGGVDLGEDFFDETIFYDHNLIWQTEQKFIRARKSNAGVALTYKHNQQATASGTEEIEVSTSDYESTCLLLSKMNMRSFRRQQKKRHSFSLGKCKLEIDVWPSIPPYIELEADSEEILQETASLLGFNWEKANTHNAAWVIENIYNIPVKSLKDFTFNRIG